ncbi:hypothetical protein BHM03_00025646 [Ensete ventricosum]|uniref:Uncharacterized protein n=1 Tax=Ensete ventricosum TaxID=4639 RepID=A0A445MH81_ENSVE|nr:hypothetical protein BHM03_00025646 [Ensete ventricosum]
MIWVHTSPTRVNIGERRRPYLAFTHTPTYLSRNHSYISPKSLAFGYLDEKPTDTGLMKFLGPCPFALSWYLEFISAFSTSSTPFTTNALPPWEQGIDDSTEVPPLRYHGVTKLIAPLSIALHLHPFLRNR